MAERADPVTLLDPSEIAPPTAHYSHVAIVDPGCRYAFVSGQVGADKHGVVPSDLDEEAALVWQNVGAALAAAGFAPASVVKITTFIVAGGSPAALSRAREQVLGLHKPASTLVYVAALARPEYHFEVEVVAASRASG